MKEMANTDVRYHVKVKDIRTRVLPALDDEFAKDVGDFQTLEALRARIAEDLQREAEAEADRQLRGDLLKELAARVTVDIPDSLVERELDRRTEEFARRLMDQQIDPQAGQHRLGRLPRQPARRQPRFGEKRAGARRDRAAREPDGDRRRSREGRRAIRRAQRVDAGGRARAAGKRRALSRLSAGLRREKAIDFVLSKAQVARD